MARHVLLKAGEIPAHVRPVGVGLRHRRESWPNRRGHDLPIELRHAGLPGVADLVHLAQSMFQRLLGSRLAAGEILAFGLGQRLELFAGKGAAIPKRHKHQALLGAHNVKALAVQVSFELFQPGLALCFDAALEGAAAGGILIAGEHFGKHRGDLGQQAVDPLTQQRAAAGGQAQGQRAVRGCKVVNVAPVGRQWSRRRLALQKMYDGARLAGAGRARGEDIVAKGMDVDAEIDGARGALLADDLVQLGRLGRRTEGQGLRITAAAQISCAELTWRHEGPPLCPLELLRSVWVPLGSDFTIIGRGRAIMASLVAARHSSEVWERWG